MASTTQIANARDWLIFGLRWLILIGLSALLLVSGPVVTVPVITVNDVATAFLVGALANVVLMLCLSVTFLAGAAGLIIVLGNVVIIGVLAWFVPGSALDLVLAAGALMLAGLVRAQLGWNVVNVASILAALFGVVFVRAGIQPALAVLLPGMLFGLIVVAGAYGLERQVGALSRLVDDMDRAKAIQAETMRDRTRAIYDLAYTMSSTMSYTKVLETALDAGRLGLRVPGGHESDLVAAVLLYHIDDNKLHVVSSRRFTRGDELTVIPGKNGIIGEALAEGVPIFATNVSKDPELEYFIAFQGCRSVMCIPLRAGFDNFGVLLYGTERANAFTEDHSDLLTALGIQATIALQNALLYKNLMEEKERIVDVEEEARKELARALHDGPTQSVAAIAMRMSIIYRLATSKPQEVPAEVKKVEDLARNTVKEIRHMLFTLRPLVLETQGLTAALSQLADKMQETHGQGVQVRVAQDIESYLERRQQGVLFYIIEEAVNNARKYAQAGVINVTLTRQDDIIIAQIADNGVGFDVGAVDAGYENRGSLGMVNMRERAELLDGSLSIDSEPGRGTVITVIVPLNNAVAPTTRTRIPVRANGKPMTKLALAASARVNRSRAN